MSAIIECNGVHKRYGSKTVLTDLSFSVDAGQPVALIGPNGAGKTTLFSLLCGYITPDQGQIRVLGQAPGSGQLTGRLAVLPQDALLDPGFSIAEQLTLFARLQGLTGKAAKIDVERVLQRVGLGAELHTRFQALSHGMRKRVSIAQALLGKPELILLDEPTAGLDPINAMAVRKLITELSDEATFVISSHNIFELEKLCGTVLYLEQGRLRHESTTSRQADQLTLTLMQAPSSDFVAALTALAGVNAVQQLDKLEWLVLCEASDQVDIAVLQLCHQHRLAYRSLVSGQTLEQQLFSVANGH